MIASSPMLEQSAEKTRSAEETVSILNNHFGPDECDRLALIAILIGKAVYEKEPNEALFWCSVFARRERNALSQATRRELQALLDDSTRWPF
ncbi:hypothetical protein [Methylocystis echinoides]|uniref:hypothetical protein n=1 Tax=Methylocystis echinoides TaxID=29468 RepID=UPI003437BA52